MEEYCPITGEICLNTGVLEKRYSCMQRFGGCMPGEELRKRIAMHEIITDAAHARTKY